jgi:CO/xanthine dehydrogenase FAD-binding subunit
MISEIPVVVAKDLAEAFAVLGKRERGLRVLAGGTDFMALLNARVGLERIGSVLDIHRIEALRGVRREADTLHLGALTTYRELIRSPEVQEGLPALAAVSKEVGAWAIQNRGTLGGNVCNASPAGDTLPILLAAGATFVVGGPRGERTLPAESFFVGYRKTDLAVDELLLRIDVPVLREGDHLVYRKVGTRQAQSISKVILALRATKQGDRLAGVKVGAGSVAPRPIRCRTAEAAILANPSDFPAIRTALDKDISPIDDVRSTASYRRKVCGNVLERMLRSLL